MLGLNVTVGISPIGAEDPPVFLLKWGTGGVAPGQFQGPNGIGVDPNGNVYVADAGNKRIQIFDGNGGLIAVWTSPGTGTAQFLLPADVAFDASGNIYVADAGNGRIQKFDSARNYLTEWDLPGARAPGLLAVRPDGAFIYTTSANDVFWIEPGSSSPIFYSWQFSPSSPSLRAGIGVGPSGDVYVPSINDDTVLKFNFGGGPLASWVTDNPIGIATDPSERVYVSAGHGVIRKFDSSGSPLASWGGFGSGDGEFITPADIAVDAAGNVFVLDLGNARVQKFGSPPTPVRRATWGHIKARYQ